MRKFIQERYFPFTSFMLKSPHAFGFIEALVDTGSPFTVLSTIDALRLRLPIKTMRKGEPVYIAGFTFFKVSLGNSLMTFKTDDQKPLTIEHNTGVLIPTKLDPKQLEAIKHIPSIVGNDFLEQQKFGLYVNPSAKVAYLERTP